MVFLGCVELVPITLTYEELVPVPLTCEELVPIPHTWEIFIYIPWKITLSESLLRPKKYIFCAQIDKWQNFFFLLHWNSLLIQVLLFFHGNAKLTVWLLCSVFRTMLINYCMTLHEILCMFVVTDRPQTYPLFTISKDHNSTSTHSRVTFLALCGPSQVGWYFHRDLKLWFLLYNSMCC